QRGFPGVLPVDEVMCTVELAAHESTISSLRPWLDTSVSPKAARTTLWTTPQCWHASWGVRYRPRPHLGRAAGRPTPINPVATDVHTGASSLIRHGGTGERFSEPHRVPRRAAFSVPTWAPS